jgi:ligand-binding SRPBCC domain-containing protein
MPKASYRLQVTLWLPRRLDVLFPFFANAGNLEAITPPWLQFFIVTPQPIDMKVGAIIDYRLRVRGIPLRWRSEITAWDPPFRFVDEQRRGPYQEWIHEHRFEELNGGTNVIDDVRYRAPGGRWIDRWFVRPDVERIFQYRQRRLAELFPAP